MSRTAKKLTNRDRAALDLVRATGFVGNDGGRPFLEGWHQITALRFRRLVELGYVEPSGDALFGGESQTYRIKREGGVTPHASRGVRTWCGVANV